MIKVKFVGFWNDFDPESNWVYRIIKKNYDVQVCEDADYIICSIFGEHYEYCNYNQVRIMYVGENYVPDFNFVDYAVSRYPLDFLDRNFYLPGFVDPFGRCESLQTRKREFTKNIFEKKPFFANFIASHESEYGIRGDFFKKLCEYKRVESPGKYMNNMGNDVSVDWTNSSKEQFQRKCKFSLCFESTLSEGFITEKIIDAFYADTIPVYYGSSTIKNYFNEKAFINCTDYDSFDDVINKIIELDQNDELYLEMLNQPIFLNPNIATDILNGLESFLKNIFNQPYENAYRRSRVYSPKQYEEYILKTKKKIINEDECSLKKLIKRLLKKC